LTNHIEGISIAGPSRPIMLKWHRLRLTAGDTDFTMRRLKEGLAAGASMEIDLRRHAEHGFVCLHEGVLESETTGRGAIHLARVDELKQLRLRGPDRAPGPEPLLLLEDLVAAVAETAHPQSVVQFDLKERLFDLDVATIAGFVRLAQPVARNVLLSGDDWTAVKALGARVPGLRLGFDPSDLPEASRLLTVDDFARFTGFVISTAPEASIIYLEYRLVLSSLAAGFDIIGALHGAGRSVDAWTLDLNSPQDFEDLAVLIGSGVDQISSNDCIAIERAVTGLEATRSLRSMQA
jgi:glycerophosphoryl diester phosphodiesterase